MSRDYMAEADLLRKLAPELDVWRDPAGRARVWGYDLDRVVLTEAEDALLRRILAGREW